MVIIVVKKFSDSIPMFLWKQYMKQLPCYVMNSIRKHTPSQKKKHGMEQIIHCIYSLSQVYTDSLM